MALLAGTKKATIETQPRAATTTTYVTVSVRETPYKNTPDPLQPMWPDGSSELSQ
jgi:hypothetical protein